MREQIGFMNGVNLTGWLSECISYDQSHFDTFITEEDICRIASSGKDHVRLPIDYNVIETLDGQPIEEGLKHIDKCLLWCRKYGLNVILDLHKPHDFIDEFNHVDYDRFFYDEELHRRFCQLWDRLIHRYHAYRDMMIIELLSRPINPSYREHWNRLASSAIKIIRYTEPEIRIMVGGFYLNTPDSIIPFDFNDRTISYVG